MKNEQIPIVFSLDDIIFESDAFDNSIALNLYNIDDSSLSTSVRNERRCVLSPIDRLNRFCDSMSKLSGIVVGRNSRQYGNRN